MRHLSTIILGSAIFLGAGQASAVTLDNAVVTLADNHEGTSFSPDGHHETSDAFSSESQDSIVTADGTGLFITGLSGLGSAASGEMQTVPGDGARSSLDVEFTADAGGDTFSGTFDGSYTGNAQVRFVLLDETAEFTAIVNLGSLTTFSGSLTGGDTYELVVEGSNDAFGPESSASWTLSFSVTNDAAPAPVPEPGTCLLALATAGMAAVRRRRAV